MRQNQTLFLIVTGLIGLVDRYASLEIRIQRPGANWSFFTNKNNLMRKIKILEAKIVEPAPGVKQIPAPTSFVILVNNLTIYHIKRDLMFVIIKNVDI